LYLHGINEMMHSKKKSYEFPLLADMHVDGVRFNRELLAAHQEQWISDSSRSIQFKPEK
jgi:hypothetical protein